MGRVRGLSAADLQLWAAYGETVPRLMPGRTRIAQQAGPPAVPESPPVRATAAPKVPRGLAVVGVPPVGLDKSTWKKFSAGRMQAVRRLDLHGHTAARAHHAVISFVENAYAEQARCIEIITGKGEILARELPHWLNAPSLGRMILAVAHPHAANSGSVRILLRRIRT